MKKLLFTLIIPFVLFACKKDNPEPKPEIETIIGTWKQTAYENLVNGKKTWVPTVGEPYYMSFRSDGLILDSNELPACCAPKAYYVNGVLFEVKPKTSVPVNERCMLVDCVGCATWDIEQTGDELILTICEPLSRRSKYIQE